MQVEGGGSCRDGFGGAIRQFRNPTKSCGWKAKGARSEQLMQVESGGSCRDGFGGAIRQFPNPTTRPEGQGSQERAANAGESRWKLQGRFWRCYPSVSEPYCGWKAKGARSEQLMQVESGGSCRDGFGGAIRQFRNPTTRPEGQGSQERAANAGESRWKLQGRFWRCYPSVSEPYKKLCGWKAKEA